MALNHKLDIIILYYLVHIPSVCPSRSVSESNNDNKKVYKQKKLEAIN